MNQLNLYLWGGVKFRLVTIGFARQANKGAPSALHLNGKIKIRGHNAHAFGAGCCITVKKGAVLDLGDNFMCTGETTINVAKSIIIGDDNLWSYNNMIMDNDGHKIYDSTGRRINEPRGMRVIGIKILDGEKPVIKNLKPEGWYPFGDYQEPTETNVGLR